MGQKANPIGLRLGITRKALSAWYAEKQDYAKNILQDFHVRKFIESRYQDAGIAEVRIERLANSSRVTIKAARPGIIIGQKGRGVEELRNKITKLMDGIQVHLNIEEIKKPEVNAKLVADTIARQLEQRVMFRRAMKRAVTSAMRAGALGVKVCVSGRLGGAEIARSEWYREGRVPLHTFRADIDYAIGEASTTYGIIGVKVWIFKGEVMPATEVEEEAAA